MSTLLSNAATRGSDLVLGIVGVISGLMWAALVVWEYQADLVTGPNSGAKLINQLGFLVATLGYVALLVGIHRARPAGSGRLAPAFTAVFVAAWVAILIGDVVGLVSDVDQDANLFLPLGGLLQGVGATGVGVTVARAKVWTGWPRWWPLILAVYVVAALLIPAFAGRGPDMLRESLWALCYSVLGLALVVSARQSSLPSKVDGT